MQMIGDRRPLGLIRVFHQWGWFIRAIPRECLARDFEWADKTYDFYILHSTVDFLLLYDPNIL